MTLVFALVSADVSFAAEKQQPAAATMAVKKQPGPVKRAAACVGRCLMNGLQAVFYYMPSTQIQLLAGKKYVEQKPKLARALQVTGYATLVGERFFLTSLAFGGPEGFIDAMATPLPFDMETARVAALGGLNLAMLPRTRDAIQTAHETGKLKALAKHHSTPGHKVTSLDIAAFLELEDGLPGVMLRDVVKEARAANRPVGEMAWRKFIQLNGKPTDREPPKGVEAP
jgi:hypothetical protein